MSNTQITETQKDPFELQTKNLYQASVLKNPQILALLADHTINFNQILKIDNCYQVYILENLQILDFLTNHQINFDQILQINNSYQVDILENLQISALLADHTINFDQILQIQKKDQVNILEKPEILDLLIKHTITFDQILQFSTMDEYYFFEENSRSRGSLNLKKILQTASVLKSIKFCADNLQAEPEAESMAKIKELWLKMDDASKKYKNLFAAGKISLSQLLRIKNCIQLSALKDDLIMEFITMENSVINVDWLLEVDNLFQVDIIKEVHIQALLTEGKITPDQLLNIKDKQSYEALMNPLIAKMLREKLLTFDDIIKNKDVGRFNHCTVPLDEFVRLCSGNSKTVPLWFRIALHANGIEVFVTDTEFVELTHSSIQKKGLTQTTEIFKNAYSEKRQSFVPIRPAYEPDSNTKQSFGSICTIYALDSNKRLLGYSILDFRQSCVNLEYLASASKAWETRGSEDIFRNIGTILFDASRMTCMNKDFEWYPVEEALPFYKNKIEHDGIEVLRYGKYFTIEKADVSRIRSYLYKNETVDLQKLPEFIVSKYLNLAERRDKALKNVPEAKPQSVDMPISEAEKMQNIKREAEKLVFMKKNFQIFTANTHELIAKRKSSSQPEKQKENLQENSEVAPTENAEENSATQSKPE